LYGFRYAFKQVQKQFPNLHESPVLSDREKEPDKNQKDREQIVGDWMSVAREPQIIVDEENYYHNQPSWNLSHLFFFLKSNNIYLSSYNGLMFCDHFFVEVVEGIGEPCAFKELIFLLLLEFEDG
jgi:hypothetical protein